MKIVFVCPFVSLSVVHLHLLVIRPIAELVSEAVDAPHDVDAAGVSQDRWDEEGVEPGLVPEEDRYHRREDEAEQRHHLEIVPEDDKTNSKVVQQYLMASSCVPKNCFQISQCNVGAN